MTAEWEREKRDLSEDAHYSAEEALERLIYGASARPSGKSSADDGVLETIREQMKEWAMSMSPRPETDPGAIERRVAALEEGRKKLEDKFDKLEVKFDKLTELVRDFSTKLSERLNGIDNRLTAIEGQLAAKAAKTDLTPIETKLGTVDGRVASLPTTPAMITLVLAAVGLSLGGAASLAFAVVRYAQTAPTP